MVCKQNSIKYSQNYDVVCQLYICQLFLRYTCTHKIFILGVLGFLKMTRTFPKIPEEV